MVFASLWTLACDVALTVLFKTIGTRNNRNNRNNRCFCNKLSEILCGFREGFSTQHALIRLIKKWRQCLDASGIVGTILMDLSKAYDCLPHDLLIAKLEAYGLDVNSLRLMYSYLDSRLQRVKIGSHRNQNWGPTRIGPRPLAL